MERLKIYLIIAKDKTIFVKSVKIALVVGTILNLINQGDAIISLDFDNINHLKSLLTYVVPFLVSTYTALSLKIKFQIGEVASINASLKCKGCGSIANVKKSELVPLCNKCNEKTKWRIVA